MRIIEGKNNQEAIVIDFSLKARMKIKNFYGYLLILESLKMRKQMDLKAKLKALNKL